jgi:glucose dehydrogenase
MTRTALVTAGALALVVSLADAAAAQEVKQATKAAPAKPSVTPGNVTQEMLDRAAGDANNFLHTNGDYTQKRYHPAAQIQRRDVRRLRRPGSSRPRSGDRWNLLPIVVNGVMYVTTSFSQVYALNAQTSEQLWYTSTRSADHHLLLRAEQPRRRGLRGQRSIWRRSTQARWRSTPRPSNKVWQSDIADPSSATARPWRRP